jgi:citrate lyase subunit beta/citryl-CoA lyase
MPVVEEKCILSRTIAAADAAPTEPEIEFARQMCSAYESGAAAGAGATGTRGVMVDAASVRVFKAVLERARLTGRG